jgi:hypothetical protein
MLKMEATIQHINFYNDGLIEMVVRCNNCEHINYHTITHSSIKNGDKTTIDFSKLGKRCCDNFHEKNGKTPKCDAEYKLYM